MGEQRDSRLFAHAAYAGDIIGTIASEREEIYHLRRRRKRPMLADSPLIVNFGVFAGSARAVELHARAHELRGILVGRGDIDVKPLRGAFHGKRADYVIRLKSIGAHDGYAQRLGKLEGVGNGGGEVLGHLFALGLVGCVGLVAESRDAGIHRQDCVRGLFALENAHKTVRQPQKRRRVDAGRGYARRTQKDEMPLVEEGHEVDDEELAGGHSA